MVVLLSVSLLLGKHGRLMADVACQVIKAGDQS